MTQPQAAPLSIDADSLQLSENLKVRQHSRSLFCVLLLVLLPALILLNSEQAKAQTYNLANSTFNTGNSTHAAPYGSISGAFTIQISYPPPVGGRNQQPVGTVVAANLVDTGDPNFNPSNSLGPFPQTNFTAANAVVLFYANDVDVAPFPASAEFEFVGSGGQPSLVIDVQNYNPSDSSFVPYYVNELYGGFSNAYTRGSNGTSVGNLQQFTAQSGIYLGGSCGCDSTAPALSHRPGDPKTGEPIDIASGNVTFKTTDYTTVGQNPLSFTRYYNSRGTFGTAPTLAATLSPDWRSTYDRYLQLVSPSIVIAERADGEQIIFTLQGSTWTPDTDVDATLTQSGTTWTFTDSDDNVETYTSASGGLSADLASIKTRSGYTQTLAYNPSSGMLTTVTDSYGRTLTLTYSSGLLSSVRTPDGTTVSYGYTSTSGTNQLTSVTYPTSPSTSQSYLYGNSSLLSALTGVVDEAGNTYETWTYDSFGRGLTSALGPSSASQNTMTLAYNDTNGSRTVTNAYGVVDTYTFNTLQGVPKVTQISRAATSNTSSSSATAAATETFTYDANGYQASATDWNGNQTTYVNNSHGLPTTINEAVGSSVARTTTIAYDPTWVHLPHTVTTPGVTTTFAYDSTGEELSRTFTDTTTATLPYSTNGQTRTWTNTWSNYLLASVKSPNSNTTSFGYSSSGALTSVTDAKGHVTNITSYTGGGRPSTVVDINGTTSTFTYDGRQRLLTNILEDVGGNYTTSYTYYNNGDVTTQWPDGESYTTLLDAAHRLYGHWDGSLATYQAPLDLVGGIYTVNILDPSNNVTYRRDMWLDALGRRTYDISHQTGASWQYSYDPNSNLLTVTDPLSHVTTNVYDALNRLSTSKDANSGVVTTTYDAHDRPLTVKDQNGNTTSYVYNGFGDVIQQTSPDTGTTVFHYDADSNLTSKTDALGIVTNQTFDALDRVLTTTYPADSTQNVAYTYDQTGAPYDQGVGKLTSYTDAAGTVTRSYDQQGNMLLEKRVKGTTTLTTAFAYTNGRRLYSITYPSGLLVKYSQDAAGRVSAVSATPPGGSSTLLAAGITYMPMGPMNAITGLGGIGQAFGYDLDYRTTSDTASSSGTSFLNLAYGYDNDDNLTSITDSLNAANSQTLGYDVINRLTSAASGTGGYGSYGYTLDKVGNRLTQTLGTATTTYSYTSGTNRLASILAGGVTTPVSNNANGNITSIPTANTGAVGTFSYNVANRLSSVTGASTAYTATYDAFGRRITKTDTGTNPSYYTYGIDGTTLEENDNGTVTDYIFADGRPVGTFAPATGKLYYLITDRQGVPQMATDSSKNIAWKTTYQPFGTTGTITASTTQNLRLPGQLADPETGFYYNMHRDYMPNLGRYLQSDPIGLVGGINTFAYVEQNPLSNTDHWGLLHQSFQSPADALPHDLDATVALAATIYNEAHGFISGDSEYLDPDLVRAMIMQESGNDMTAHLSDPMQVNVSGDWVPEKQNIGLLKGTCTNPLSSILAGIDWLSYKAYVYDDSGDPVSFRGWPAALERYNGGGDPMYVPKVYGYYGAIKQMTPIQTVHN